MRAKGQSGFTLLESVFAIFILSVASLALAATFVGAAEQTRRSHLRVKALEMATQQLDRLRSLPYSEVKHMSGTGDPFYDDYDWRVLFCPLRSDSPECANLGGMSYRMVQAEASDNFIYPSNPADPRRSKRAVNGSSVSCSASEFVDVGDWSRCRRVTVKNKGVILYTYIYWNACAPASAPLDCADRSQYKIATVVARYLDPQTNNMSDSNRSSIRDYASVKVSAVIADIPELGQVE